VPDNGQALSAAERQAVLTLINTPAYADLSIGQIWARELDAGTYLCSASSMYRIARAAGQSRERRRQATHPAKAKPELLADAPSQVWTWDITKLRGPAKGIFY
jgi:putative transposase